jgi:hypothetical protein
MWLWRPQKTTAGWSLHRPLAFIRVRELVEMGGARRILYRNPELSKSLQEMQQVTLSSLRQGAVVSTHKTSQRLHSVLNETITNQVHDTLQKYPSLLREKTKKECRQKERYLGCCEQ